MAKRLDPDLYTETYYLSSCEGYDLFRTSGGRRLTPRLRRALALAEVRPGDRVLDIACGRGEVVLQAALRGADAVGIDYAAAAVSLARQTVDGRTNGRGRAAVVRMDATRLGFPDAWFDTVFMLDFVEHVYEHELRQCLSEAFRVLRPGGRLVVHTSPNRLFEQVVYPHYVRHVHRVVLALTRRLGLRSRLLNPLMLPTSPSPPHDEFERKLHVNEQTAAGLTRLLRAQGFEKVRVDYWEPSAAPYFTSGRERVELLLLDGVRYLRPLSRFWPLSALFSNHIWVLARRPA